jgi:hypothetical protein
MVWYYYWNNNSNNSAYVVVKDTWNFQILPNLLTKYILVEYFRPTALVALQLYVVLNEGHKGLDIYHKP